MSVTTTADEAFDKAAVVTRPLGGYRLFLAFLVMMQHIGINLMPASVHQYYFPYAPGTIGVVAFLFLSSFLILEVASLGYLSKWRRFIANRAIRILPEYYIGLAIAIAVQFFLFHHGVAANRYAWPTSSDAFSLSSILGNAISLVPMPTPLAAWDFMIAFWTVRYEISFYLFVFLVLLVVSVVPQEKRRRTFELAVLFASVLLLSARFIMPISGTPLFMVQIFSFLAIGALFWLQRRSETLTRMPDFFAYGALTALLVVNLFQYTNSIHATVATAFAALTGAMLTGMSIEDRKLAKLDHACGDLSYTIFLLHIPVAQLVKNYLGTSIASFSTAMIMSFVVAIPISVGVRRATRPLRDRVRGRKLV